jgi:hypothetical protein
LVADAIASSDSCRHEIQEAHRRKPIRLPDGMLGNRPRALPLASRHRQVTRAASAQLDAAGVL